MLQLEDSATQLLKLVRLRLGKDLQQDVSEHDKRFLHLSARLYQQSMQHYIAEESNLHEQTAITKSHWIRGHPIGMTPRNMMMSTIRKRPTGPRIITRPAMTTTLTEPSPNTFPHF